jgi:hypothetical protein
MDKENGNWKRSTKVKVATENEKVKRQKVKTKREELPEE